MKFNYFRVTPEDVDKLELKPCYTLGEVGVSKYLVSLAMSNDDSMALGFGDGERILGIAGSYRQWAGAAQAWAVLDVMVDKYPIAMRRACFQLLEYAVKKQGLRRISLTVRNDYTEGNRFAHSLGFDFEGRMYAYLPEGVDANLYARLY